MINEIDPSFAHAELRIAELHAAANHHRLVNEYRIGHPERRLRHRTAGVLRRLADRLAPVEPARPGSRLQAVTTTR
jgi:hypothetical protein